MIAQQDSMGCGIATVANLLEISYDNALNLFENGNHKAKATGFLCKDIVTALNKAGENYQYKYIRPSKRNKIYNKGIIVFIKRSKTYPYGHYLARINSGWIDPWINIRHNKDIKEAKAGIRKMLPGKPIYAILPI